MDYFSKHSFFFNGLYGSGMRETITKTVIMKEYSSKIIAAALNWCQGINVLSILSIEDILKLYQFVDSHLFEGLKVGILIFHTLKISYF